MKFSHRMTGHDELRKRLQAIPVAIAHDVSVDALKDAAEPMRAEAAVLAPRSKGKGPHMADNIIVAETRFGGAVGPDVTTVAIGPDKRFWYDTLQEFGTARHAPHPFMRPAFDRMKTLVKKRLADSVWTAIRRRGGA